MSTQANEAGLRLRHELDRRVLVLDGAVGTELERRGVATKLPLWSAQALLDAPDVVEQIHRDYVAAGADILVANTFRTNPRTLRKAALLDRGAGLNALAVELARRAAADAGRRVWVAASIAPVEDCYRPDLVPDEPVLRAEHEQMVRWLTDAGPDLLWIETIGTVREAVAAAGAAAAAGWPFVVSFVVRERGELLSGEPLREAVAAVEPCDPVAIGLNCIPPAGLDVLLPKLRALTARPLVAYGHINNPRPIQGWSYCEHLTPGRYAAHVERWLRSGVRIVGGCCGTTPAHVRAVAEAVHDAE